MTEEEKTTKEEKVTEEDKGAEEAKVAEESVKPEEDKSAEEGKAAEKSEKTEESKTDEKGKKKDEKPLDKMTVKELKEVAKDIPEIVGVHGMNKPDLLTAIKKSRGIEEAPKKKTDVSLLNLKKQIKSLKIKRGEAIASKDKKMATIFKRQISRLKKRTRRAA
jgi:hypothetical protein